MPQPERSDEGRHRDLPGWVRIGSVVLRAGHVAGFAVIAGAEVAGAAPRSMAAWWALVASTGLMLVATEWASHPDLWRQMSGWATLTKLALLAIAAALPPAAAALMLAAMAISVLGAHLPRRWRTRLIVPWRSGPR